MKWRIKSLHAVCYIWLFAVVSHAQAYEKETVAQLAKECSHVRAANPTPEDIRNAYSCFGYVQAAAERPEDNFFSDIVFCPLHKSLTLQHQIDLFLAWAKAHPESSAMDAHEGVWQSRGALLDACPKDVPPGFLTPPMPDNKDNYQ